MANIDKEKSKIIEPGIYPGVSYDEYASWTPVRASTLNGFSRTPVHVYHEMTHGGKDSTPAMDLGTLVHMGVLELDRFRDEVVAAPRVDKRTKVGKQTMVEFEAANADKLVVAGDIREKAILMAGQILFHPTGQEFFITNKGHNELSFVWDDEESGVRCMGRADRVASIGEWPIVGDIKTARDASRRAMEKAVYNFGYHVQAAHYLAGLQALAPIPDGTPFRRYCLFVVESEAPYACAVYEVDDSALAEGEALRRKYLEQWRECVESGNWPGYAPGVEYVSLPAWAYKIFQE